VTATVPHLDSPARPPQRGGAGRPGRTSILTSPFLGKYASVLITVALLVAMFSVGAGRYDNFASPQVVLNLFVDNAFLIVLAVGMTFVILTGGIDLSVGSVVALSTMIAASLLQTGWPAPVVIVLVIAAATVLGLLVGLMIHYFDVQPFIATLAAMFLARGLCYLISLKSIAITDPLFTELAQARIQLAPRISITPAALIAVAIVVLAALVLKYTRFGRTVYAIGGNEQSARLMGLPVVRTKVLVYTVSGLCSGIAGILFSFYTLSGYSLTGIGLELDAIAAVVIGGTLLTGGTGFVLGSLLGVLVLGLIQTVISFEGTLSSWWTKIVIGGLLLIFILIQRLLTRRSRTSSR